MSLGAVLDARRARSRPGAVWATVRLLPGASAPLAAAVALGVVTAAALPALLALATGALVDSVEAAVGTGLQSFLTERRLVVPVATVAGLFVAARVAGPVVRVVADALGRRLDSQLQAQVMAATSAPAGIAHLEDPEVLDQVAVAQGVGTSRVTVREATVGLASVATGRLASVGSAAVLAGFRWWLALVLLVVHTGMHVLLTANLANTVAALRGHARRFRRTSYFRDLGLSPAAGKELRIFGLGSWVGERFDADWRSAMAQFWVDRRRGRWLGPAYSVVLLVVQGGAFALLGRSAVRGEISLGELTAYAIAVGGVAAVPIGIDDLNIGYGTASVPAVLALPQVVATSGAGLDGERPAEGLPTKGIRFEGVSFRYPGGRGDVFYDLDLDIPAGRSLAVVGNNGAGKTSLVKLLCRLYDPTSGRILVDGTDLAELDPRAWQRRVAAIFQDFIHYDLPVADNIGFGAIERGHDPEVLAQAAGRAGATGIVDALPWGWETVLSRRYRSGVDLSGGQWQRVAMARALAAVEAGAGVLVLDEPTAALDVRAEAAFYDRFLQLTRGITTVVISHRFSTVRRADRIVVMENGRISEAGDHHGLLASGGRYAHMFRLQAARFADPADPADPAGSADLTHEDDHLAAGSADEREGLDRA